MNSTDPIYYYVDANRQTTGPVSEDELRRLLAQGVLTQSSNILRKGESQWKHPSDFLIPEPTPAQAQTAYYYADANRQTTGPVSEDELRRLLAQGVLTESSNVIRKGESQWIRLSQVLSIGNTPYTPSPSPYQTRPAVVGRPNMNIKFVEEYLDHANSFIDNSLYSIFGFRKLAPYFQKWAIFSVHLTGILTTLLCVLAAFTIRAIVCTPKPVINIFMTTEQIEAAKKAAEESCKMSAGDFMLLLIAGLLAGILLQYIVGLFSKANLSYFYVRKPVLSSMLWPRFNVIILCLLLLGVIYCFFSKSGGEWITISTVSILVIMYFTWIHLNSDKIFLEISGQKEASGTSDLIGYIMYSLRYALVALQTLTPFWLLILNVVCVYLLFSDIPMEEIKHLLKYDTKDILYILALILVPITIHLGYIILSLIPELILALLHGKKNVADTSEQAQ